MTLAVLQAAFPVGGGVAAGLGVPVWFEVVLDARPNRTGAKLENDSDADFREALTVSLAELVAGYRVQCEASREIVAKLAPGTLVSVKVLIDLVEETGRHAGHLDLLSELTDGRTGE